MKLPGLLRDATRALLGLLGSEAAPKISAEALRELAAREEPLVLAFGRPDPRLPGEQRRVRLATLQDSVREVPRGRLIVTHCA